MNQLKLISVSVEHPAQADAVSAASEPTNCEPTDPAGSGGRGISVWAPKRFAVFRAAVFRAAVFRATALQGDGRASST